ncbi:alpha/beta hydrolase [soil metagenome]
MRTALAFNRRIWSLIRLKAPPALLLRVWGWILGYLAREFAPWYVALLGVGIVLAIALGAVGSTLGAVAVGLAALIAALEARFAWEGWRSAAAIERELEEEIPGDPPDSRFPRSHLWLPFLTLFARSVERTRNVVFHREERRILRLDVYRSRADKDAGRKPAVIQVHGGGWILGSRSEQGIPLLNHLAANGWVGFNVDYQLSPRATLPDHVIDVKRAIAWVREHADEYGVDPERIAITGGSAGGHLTALAALTANDPELQPGFEEADTSVIAAVPFYGVYDLSDELGVYYPELREWLFERVVIKKRISDDPELFRSVSPTHRIHADAPPFMVFHGDSDSLVPVADAREFVRRLEDASSEHVLYVELPGAEHAFDLLPSLRTARVVEGIERFLRTVLADEAQAAEPVRARVGSRA